MPYKSKKEYLMKNTKGDNIFNVKFNIFKCAIKFLSRNDKEKLKNDNIYSFIKESISIFLKTLSAKNLTFSISVLQ